MGDAKKIFIRQVRSADANAFVRAHHYSGKVTQNSQLHLGAFMGETGHLVGVMQFGPSIDKRRMCGLVSGTAFGQFCELNRMAFSEEAPRNSESRALGFAMRLLRRSAPALKWVVSFSDACQCGDGTIYRASGFVLTAIRRNTNQLLMPDGTVTARKALDHDVIQGARGSIAAKRAGAVPVEGFQLRYVYFPDPSWRTRLTVPEVPFSAIRDAGASMYRGQRGVSSGEPRPPSLEGVRPDHAAPSTHNTGGKAERVGA